jgi:hypothetical protein
MIMREELLKGLTEEQIEKLKECKNQEEVLKLAKEEGIELTDDQLEAVSGGCSGVECCPKCGSKNLQTHPYTLLDHELTYDVVCLDCHYRW